MIVSQQIIVVTKRCCHAKISFIGLVDDWSWMIIQQLVTQDSHATAKLGQEPSGTEKQW